MRHQLSRRMLLRGVGAAVALPWLESIAVAASGANQIDPPVRLGFFYVPNGVNLNDWRPAKNPVLEELPKTLQGLTPVKDRVIVLSNLAADHCHGKDAGHEPTGGGFLVGTKCKHSEEPEVGGISIDQLAAREIGMETRIDSLTLGVDPGHRGDHGYSGTYLSHISWRSKTTPSTLELNPKLLFNRLFRGQAFQGQALAPPVWSRSSRRNASVLPETSIEKSVLDLVKEDTRSLQRQLGYNDRQKLEEYLEGLRSVEQRIASATKSPHSHHQDAFHDAGPSEHDDPQTWTEIVIPDGKGIPSLYADHVNLMLDILTLAFQTDTTRLATFMFSYEKSGRAYPEIDARAAHHSSSHHNNEEQNLTQLTRINAHHINLFARMLERMSKIQEGERTLLDNVLFCYGSGIGDGNKHNHDDLPILVAGGAGGTLTGGRHIAFEEKTPICNLYLEMLHRAGMNVSQFGDSTGRLSLV